jgi:hypothetical protein
MIPTRLAVTEHSKIPDEIGSLRAMTPDYVDLFSVPATGAPARSPEEWARATIEDSAGRRGQFVWRAILGLRLDGRPSPDRIGGWRIAGRGADWLRVEASSWFLTAHLVVRVDDARVSVATFVRYDRPPAGLVWPPLSAIHRRAMPGLLRSAARHAASKG